MELPFETSPDLMRFKEIYESAPLGGGSLAARLGRPDPGKKSVYASVEFATRPGRDSRVQEGPLADHGAADLIGRLGNSLAVVTLAALVRDDFSFEVRISSYEGIDSPVSMIMPTRRGSIESKFAPAGAAIILDAEPGSKFYYGRRRTLPEDRFISLVRKSPGHEVLQEREALPGGVFLIPPGLPFSFGRDVTAYTALVEDCRAERAIGLFGGGIRGGNLVRDLVTAPVPDSRLLVTGRGFLEGLNAVTWLYATDLFCTVRLDLREQWEEKEDMERGGSLKLLTGLSGRALVSAGDGAEVLEKGRTVVVSASCREYTLNPEAEGAVLLKTWFPDRAAQIERPLREHGISQREIEGLFGFFGKNGL